MNSLVGNINDKDILDKMAKMFDDGGYSYTNEVLCEYFSKWLNVPKSCFLNYRACFEPWFMLENGTYKVGEIYKSNDPLPKYFLVFKVANSFAFTLKYECAGTGNYY